MCHRRSHWVCSVIARATDSELAVEFDISRDTTTESDRPDHLYVPYMLANSVSYGWHCLFSSLMSFLTTSSKRSELSGSSHELDSARSGQ